MAGEVTGDMTAQDTGCEFCRIAEGSAFARVVHEDRETVAFLPLQPVGNGHVLVVPRRHVKDLWGLNEATAVALTRSVLRVAHAVRSAFRPAGLNVIHSSGEAASQTVMHLHVHVVARYEGDRMGSFWPPPLSPEPGRLDVVAERLRTAMAAGATTRSAEQDSDENGEMGERQATVEE